MVQTGLDRLLARPESLRNRRFGLIVNHTSVTAELRYGWDALSRAGLRAVRIFSPEHGLFGTEQDQVPAAAPAIVPCQVVSLYGGGYDSLTPLESHLDDIDSVLFDIQDVGSRYYTYVNTMILFLRAIDGRGISFFVLDRPNPLGGTSVEGPVLKKGFESFVGILPVPVRHGLTAGELARMAHDYYGLDVDLHVIEMKGWSRGMRYEDTGLPWVPPSPNMPTTRTAAVYPGACLIEGTNVSEGRGTATPFEIIGAPGVHPDDLAGAMEGMRCDGATFRPTFFRPMFGKYCGEELGGVFIHVNNPDLFRPFRTGVALVTAFSRLMPGFKFLHGVYEFNSERPAFDLLTGGSFIREMILEGKSLEGIAAIWEHEEAVFSGMKEQFHLYRY